MRFAFFDDFFESFASEDDSISFFEAIFDFIRGVLHFILNLFLGLFSDSSSIGRDITDFFEDLAGNGLSIDVFYIFFGLITIVFIFRLLWDLIP